eukprot:Lithocolla_globosa_v1_NODE_152_length_5671_cov_121.982906.p1 type:complete len:465 gc:universal NODE_152_length_5671_cov_121.982906:2437-3831(+)
MHSELQLSEIDQLSVHTFDSIVSFSNEQRSLSNLPKLNLFPGKVYFKSFICKDCKNHARSFSEQREELDDTAAIRKRRKVEIELLNLGLTEREIRYQIRQLSTAVELQTQIIEEVVEEFKNQNAVPKKTKTRIDNGKVRGHYALSDSYSAVSGRQQLNRCYNFGNAVKTKLSEVFSLLGPDTMVDLRELSIDIDGEPNDFLFEVEESHPNGHHHAEIPCIDIHRSERIKKDPKFFQKVEKIMCSNDLNHTNRKSYRSLSYNEIRLPREYIIADEKKRQNKIMQQECPITPLPDYDSGIGSDIEDSDSESDDDGGDEIDAFKKEIPDKNGYTDGKQRKMRDLLQVALLLYSDLISQDDVIKIKLSGDGRNVGRKIKHVMITFCLFNSGKLVTKPDHQFCLSIYVGKEGYDALRQGLAPLFEELNDLQENGFYFEGVHYDVELFFTADWKFMALVLGLNGANCDYF